MVFGQLIHPVGDRRTQSPIHYLLFLRRFFKTDMRRRVIFLTIYLISLYFISNGQQQNSISTEIYGTVFDAKTKEVLPYVNVRLKGAIGGATTDPKGYYYIKTIGRVDSISFSYLGYQTRTIAVIRGKIQEIDIPLGETGILYKDIEIKVKPVHPHRHIDTAAQYVFHKVVANKARNRSDDLLSYKYQSYEKLQLALLNAPNKFTNFWFFRPFKFVFDNKDTTQSGNVFIPGILKETISEVYFRRHPRSYREYVRAEAMSGLENASLIKFANYHFADLDAYDDQFVIGGPAFVAPFAPNAMSTYRYYMTDTAIIDGRVSYRIAFQAKFKEDLALKGWAWIDSATWAIRSIQFAPNDKANINFVNEYTIKQDYILVDSAHWFKNREELTTVGSIFKNKNKMSILVTKVDDRRDIQVDVAIPDSMFKGVEQEILLDSARHRSRAYWDTARFEPLTPQEQRVYFNIDTIKTMRVWKFYQSLGRFATAAYIDAGPVSIGRVLNFVSYNNVEGVRLRFGFETNPRFKQVGNPVHDFFHHFYLNAYGAYGLKDHQFKYQAYSRIALPKINDRWQLIEFFYRYDFRVPGQDEKQTVLTFDNVLTLLSGTTLSYIMDVREARFTYEKEWFHDLSSVMSFDQKTYYDVPGVFNFSRPTADGGMQYFPNFSVSEFMWETRYSYKDLYYADPFFRFFLTTRFPVFILRYTLGLCDVQGNYFNYHQFLLTIKQRLSSSIGHTNYLFRAGKIFGEVPYTAAYMTQGNLGILYDQFNYSLLQEFEFVSDQYVSLWVEHHFDGFFLNKIPLVNKLKLREIIFARSLLGSFSQKNADVLTVPSQLTSPEPIPYVEAGFGIENIFYLARVDFVWRLTYRYVGPTWGIKIAINPAF